MLLTYRGSSPTGGPDDLVVTDVVVGSSDRSRLDGVVHITDV